MPPRLGPSNPLARNPLTSALAESQTPAGPQRTTFSLSLDVAERARDAAHYQRVPVVEIVETAIRSYVATLEQERGEPFPARPRPRRRRRLRS